MKYFCSSERFNYSHSSNKETKIYEMFVFNSDFIISSTSYSMWTFATHPCIHSTLDRIHIYRQVTKNTRAHTARVHLDTWTKVANGLYIQLWINAMHLILDVCMYHVPGKYYLWFSSLIRNFGSFYKDFVDLTLWLMMI